MKFLAFFLALIIGMVVWFFTFGLIFAFLKMYYGISGAIPMYLLWIFPIYFIVRFFYKLFLKKFGYEVVDEEDSGS